MDKRIGAQFYTIRDYTQNIADFDKSCKKIAKIGYKAVQISGTPLEAKLMKEILDKYNLEVYITHKDMDTFINNLDYIIDYNKTLGCALCGIKYLPKKYRADYQSLEKTIEHINKIGDALQKENLHLGYHNHAFEFSNMSGKNIMEYLIEETDPEKVSFIVDAYWLQVGGKNPPDFIKRLGKRAVAVHFKDYAVSENTGVITEVGKGNLDWDSILSACEEAGTKWILVEQDNNWVDNDPFRSLEISYHYLTKKGLC